MSAGRSKGLDAPIDEGGYRAGGSGPLSSRCAAAGMRRGGGRQRPGQRVESGGDTWVRRWMAGDVVAILELMKMEMRVVAPSAGKVREVLCQPGRLVQDGQRLMVLGICSPDPNQHGFGHGDT